jgi:hypothetical protein
MTTPGEHLQAYLASRQRVLTTHTEVLVALSEHPVLFTAPHGKLHVRDGARKRSDDNTTVLALEAARASGARSVVLAAPAGEDGNWDPDSRFRGIVLGLLRVQPGVLVDVHGMRDVHGPDVIAGTAGGATPPWLVEIVEAAAERHRVALEVRHEGPLSAGGRTLTAYVMRELAQPAVQLEFATRVRSPRTNRDRFSEMVEFLAAIAVGVSGAGGAAGAIGGDGPTIP